MLEVSPVATKPFDDVRGRLSEELAFEAEVAARKGNSAESKVLFITAAGLEEKAARDVSKKQSRARRVLAISAAALWLKAGRRDEAERVEAEFGVANSHG